MHITHVNRCMNEYTQAHFFKCLSFPLSLDAPFMLKSLASPLPRTSYFLQPLCSCPFRWNGHLVHSPLDPWPPAQPLHSIVPMALHSRLPSITHCYFEEERCWAVPDGSHSLKIPYWWSNQSLPTHFCLLSIVFFTGCLSVKPSIPPLYSENHPALTEHCT